MDHTDLAILSALDKNSRATVSEISKEVNLSTPAVSERIRKLEDAGIITQYTVKLNSHKMNLKLTAFVFVTLKGGASIAQFRESINSYPEVLECHHIAGEYDYLLKVLLQDTQELERFISHRLKGIFSIQKTNTLVNLSTIKSDLNRIIAL
jgi:Lrp/AsnC family leucine-responsive transcriptional regulator